MIASTGIYELSLAVEEEPSRLLVFFAFGNAPFKGSDLGLGQPVIAIGDDQVVGVVPPGKPANFPDDYCIAAASGQIDCNS